MIFSPCYLARSILDSMECEGFIKNASKGCSLMRWERIVVSFVGSEWFR